MTRRKDQLFVFDWNGTLLADTVASWKAANVCLEFYGAPAISLSRYRESFYFPVIHFYRLNGVDTDTVLAKKPESNVLFQETYEKLAARARTRSGARKLLEFLHTANSDSIILSNYRTNRIIDHLNRLKINRYFKHIDAHDCDGTTILHSTTKAERLETYMKTYGYSSENTIIIGDSHEEPEIARLLGLTCIGITDGYISRRRLREAHPRYIVNTLTEIIPLVRGGLPAKNQKS